MSKELRKDEAAAARYRAIQAVARATAAASVQATDRFGGDLALSRARAAAAFQAVQKLRFYRL